MKYRRMGRTGLVVSEICLGGWLTYGGDLDDEESKKIIRTAVKRGINFFDTAEAYADGRSEEVMGEVLSEYKRSEVVIATKVAGPLQSKGPNQSGLSRKHILEACEASLDRLGTDYIDLYQVHWWDSEVPLEETLETLNDLVRSGMVHYLGCSNFSAEQLYHSLEICANRGWARFECIQPHYNLLDRKIEKATMPLCKLAGVGIIPYSPLAGGILTGKYKTTKPPKGTRASKLDFARKRLTTERLAAVRKLAKIAKARNKTVGQLALAWILSHEEITSPIIGASSLDQLKENLGGTGWKLKETEITEIEKIVADVQY
jgi:aryl-alcohol dehydrogenase-like predicted oxidoreductase